MTTTKFQVRIVPPRYDTHYCGVVCEGYRAGLPDEPNEIDTYRYETGVPTREALAEIVTTQRSEAVAALTGPASEVETTVEIEAGFTGDITGREVLGEGTLARFGGDSAEFEWATSRPEYEQYLRCLRTHHGQRALEIRVSVHGEDKRVFVGASATGSFVATGDTDWLTNLQDTLQECRLVAALGEYRARYDLERARVVDLTTTPLASCQPFQRRSVMWASPRSGSVR